MVGAAAPLWAGFLVVAFVFVASTVIGVGALPEGPVSTRSSPGASSTGIMVNNLGVVFLLMGGWLTFGLSTVATIAWNGFVVGLQAAAAASEFGWTPTVLALAPHGILEVPAFLLAGAVGTLPAVRTVMTLKTGTRPPRRRGLTMMAVCLSATAIVVAAPIEVAISTRIWETLVQQS